VLRAVLLLALSACGFHSPKASGAGGPDADAGADADGDGPAPRALCEPDPSLLVCFSFDADPLPASLANEGGANVAATLSDVTRIPRGTGGAALLNTTSQMRVPPNSVTIGFATVEAWLRVDADPPVNGRAGILDADPTSSAMSLFYYYGSSSRQVRFELGQPLYVDFTLDLGAWHYLAAVCQSGTLTAFVDGVKVGERTGCSPGDSTTYGLQLGQNNTGSGGSEGLVGAIDGIRMWTQPLSPTAICQTAGRTGC